MHYWNDDNFRGLTHLASELNKHANLQYLSEYCTLREKGLRKQALEKLDEFLHDSKQWDLTTKREMTVVILRFNSRTPEAHQFITHPLLRDLINPTLDDWREEDPNAIEPLRWIGLLRSDFDTLCLAIELKPSDISVRSKLINLLLDEVYFATHHLNESVLLSNVEDIRETLKEAAKWIKPVHDHSPFKELSQEVAFYKQLMDDWDLFNESSEQSFPLWCELNGKSYEPTDIN